jgi:hypothetical protein
MAKVRAVGTAEVVEMLVAKGGCDFLDLGDLFQGGADKVGEAFPGILSKRAKTGKFLDG